MGVWIERREKLSREIEGKMDLKSRGANLYKLHNLRSIESYRELLSFKKVCFSYQTTIKELSRISPKDSTQRKLYGSR